MSLFSCACFNLVVSVVLCRGSEFLKKERHEHVSEDDIRVSLLSDVESTLGIGSAASRVPLLEEILKPMYASLPKNVHGRLGHSTVRYALHRLFTLRHGWHIKGLGRDAGALNITSPSGVLKDQVPAYIQDMFEKRLGDKGLGLQELAVMAATMEHLIHQEAVGKLRDVFGLHMVLPTEQVDESKADELLNTYMMAFVLGENISNLTLETATATTVNMPQLFVGWLTTQAFVRRIRNNITDGAQKLSGAPPSYDFPVLAKVAAVVGEEFGTFQDADCRKIKAAMMEMEFRGTGRVRLAEFYKPALDGNWQFQESVGYLRQLGALDESDPNDIRVIIVNYIHSQTNCIAASGFYSVCCKDECEGLFGHLEEKLAASDVPAAAISAIVENLPSSTVDAPRNLSRTLLNRLDDIAAEHGGMVPLHGRLFAQWMHHAYPRECPFPHVSGTTSQLTGQEFVDESGVDSIANEDEMAEFLSSSETDESFDRKDEELLPWSPEEELLVQRFSPLSKESRLRFTVLRPVVLLAVAGALTLSLVQAFNTLRMHETDTVNAKFLV